MPPPDDILQLAAVMMPEDGCCQRYDDKDNRCCMSGNAQRVLDAVIPKLLTEIALSGMRAGIYTGVLDHYARRNGIEWTHPEICAIQAAT